MSRQQTSVFFAVILVAVGILLGPQAVFADNNSLNLSFVVPEPVNSGIPFTITVNVTNKTQEYVTFNRAAAGYALPDMKIKGPYEVYTTTHSLPPGGTTSFSFSFRIAFTSGSIIPVVVMLAKDSYQGANMKGSGAIGIKVN